MTLVELYRLTLDEGVRADQARALLRHSHWFSINAKFDPKTGDALPQELSAFLAKVAHPNQNGTNQDRLHRLTEHARPSVERILRSLNESPRRQQALLPVHAVRELDVNSFIKLSNRPGRNIREKLAGKPYLQAVRRYQSVNLPENRLFKAFLVRLSELLKLRRDLLRETEDDLIPRIQSWLRGDKALAIARWENLPPNNTLLAHRDYRRVWDAWRDLQTLDDDIERDFSRLDERQQTMTRWIELGRMYLEGAHNFAEMPVTFNYKEFSIKPWIPELLRQNAAKRLHRDCVKISVTEPVCIDLAEIHPRFAVGSGDSHVLEDNFLWQRWNNGIEAVDITLFDSDAAYLHRDATTIGSPDLFFATDKSNEYFDRAAWVFAQRLREKLKNDSLVWLVPDALNDFELPVIRRNLNARFPGAEPLPRSVAALFEQVDYTRITKEGFPVLVVDTLGGTICATKLIARFRADLKKRLPETNGYYWERCPPVIISECESRVEPHYDMVTLGGDGEWQNCANLKRPQFIDSNQLKRDPRIDSFAYCINLADSPVVGGMRLHELQSRAGEIPLWKDQIPELSIKVVKDGRHQRFNLVSQGTTIKPIRGLAGERIPIAERFVLPAGKRFYQFTLYQGENASELRFSARLDSHAFPLKSNTECELILTFHYGDDEPYNLLFVPIDKPFPAVRATWQRTVEGMVVDATAPEYPDPLSWDELRTWHDGQGNEVDLFEWLIYRLSTLRDKAKKRHGETVEDTEKRTFFNISRRAFVNRLGVMWSDGRSLADNCDQNFVREFKNNLQAVAAMRNRSQRIECCVWQIFACLHKDAPSICIEWLTDQVLSGNIRDPRAVGFALGDVSQEWQQAISIRLASRPSNHSISVFSYAIWRERHFVDRFSLSELKSLLKSLSWRMEQISPPRIAKNEGDAKWARRKWVRMTAEPLELLLGLLRTRASEDPEIRMLLQPHRNGVKLLAEQIERIEEIVAESNISLVSRVQIDVQKPDGIRTPDLLYALHLYLTGDDGANSIHITGISDSDDD